jgi:hypothetical protein
LLVEASLMLLFYYRAILYLKIIPGKMFKHFIYQT